MERRNTFLAHRDACIVRSFVIIVIGCTLIGCGRSVLPPERTLVATSEAALRALVLSHAPIGMTQKDVEKVLATSLRRGWRVVHYESRELISKRGFSVPVVSGDYYLKSDIAMVRRDIWSSDVVTVYFLFGSSGQLKDIAIMKWTDSI
jgi:hypothetical protein